jgi:hypothetical protein
VILIDSIAWGEEETTISFAVSSDLRDVAGKPLLCTRQLVVPNDHPRAAEFQEVLDAAVDAVRDLLADYESADVHVEPDDEPDDDDDDDDD